MKAAAAAFMMGDKSVQDLNPDIFFVVTQLAGGGKTWALGRATLKLSSLKQGDSVSQTPTVTRVSAWSDTARVLVSDYFSLSLTDRVPGYIMHYFSFVSDQCTIVAQQKSHLQVT